VHTIPKLKPETELTPIQKRDRRIIWDKLAYLRAGVDKLPSHRRAKCLAQIEHLVDKSIKLGLHEDC
jgi:hypothetical protein